MVGSLLLIAVILVSLTVHEYSHGRVAYMLGDDTARKRGRLTLNPLKHLDPIGTLFFYFMHFGWAKPVPVDPRNLQDPHRDMLFIAAAGPASNLVLALISGFFLRFMGPLEQMEQTTFYVFGFLCIAVYCNVALAIFNMLPIFPLDGSSVLKGLVPRRMAMKLDQLDKYFGMILLAVFLTDYFAKTGILSSIIQVPIIYMLKFFTQEAFPSVVGAINHFL
ncbi:MAG: site-2 protease family protein [Nitrospinota bacterium]|nr:site-2 protease family protein [Nitrospinota bacterium]